MIMLARVIILALLISSASVVGLAQAKRRADTSKTVRLIDDKPTVYLEFVKVGVCRYAHTSTILSGNPCQSTRTDIPIDVFDAVWLRLVNNTRWAIEVRAGNGYVPPIVDGFSLQDKRIVTAANDRAEIDAVYEVEAETGCDFHKDGPNGEPCKPINVQAPDVAKPPVFTRIFIPAGNSLILAVRREHLAEYLKTYVLFSYEWETSAKFPTNFEEPKHRVYFSWYKLEKAIHPVRQVANR
jgi:hypothetical protein